MFIGTRRNPVYSVLLTIVSCTFYFLWLQYATTKEINSALGREELSPVIAIIGWFCWPVLLYHYYKVDLALQELDRAHGKPASDSKFILWLILTVVCGIGSFIYIYQTQDALNSYWDIRSAGQQPQAPQQ